jgi:hypothetical protein
MFSALFIIALMLQSCSIYKKIPASLDEAARANARTIVVTDNSKQEFIRITSRTNITVRLKLSAALKKVPLSETDIKAFEF